MTDRDAYDAALARLRGDGVLSDDTLAALCGGDYERADRVAQRLLRRGLATADGFDLRLADGADGAAGRDGALVDGDGTEADDVLPVPVPDDGRYDLFVSYAHADDDAGQVAAMVAEIQAIQQQYERGHLRVFFDRDGIRTMDDWERRILEALKSSKAMLAVLSPAYFASTYCRREWRWFLDRETDLGLTAQGVAGLYVVSVPGFEAGPEAIPDDWKRDLARRQYEDLRDFWAEGLPALQRDAVRARMEALELRCHETIRRAERAEGSRSNVPPHNPYFVGRTEELRRIRHELLEGQLGAIVATQGLGGMGKSALVFEYAHAFAEQYPGGRFLVASEGRRDLGATLIENATDFGVTLTEDEQKSPALALARVRATLEEGPAALLLFDNVTDAALLAPAAVAAAMPRGVHVLATTRLAPTRLGPQTSVVEVGPLPEADALRLLDTYRPFRGEADPDAALAAARDLVGQLGGYALAVEVVAVYLWKHPGVSYPAYRARLAREDLAGLDATGATDDLALSRHTETVLGRLLAPTLDALTEAEALALAFAAVLPPDAVVGPWLRALVGQARPGLVPEAVPGYPDPWQQVVRRLHGLRLLTPTEDARVSRMHRLVRGVVQQRLGEGVAERDEAAHAHLLDRAKRLCNDGWIDRVARWELAPLAETVTWLVAQDDVRAGTLANWVSSPFKSLGELLEARRLLENAIRIDRTHYDPDHPTLATSYSDLAMVLKDLGDLAEARRLLEDAIRIDRTHYDPDHPTLATRYSNLAMVLKDLGELAEARRLLEDAIRILKVHHGEDYHHLATTYSNLAMVLQDLGDLPEARRLLEDALRIDRTHYDADHPTLATSYSNLALVLKDLGDLAEARRRLEDAIRIWRTHYDPDHPTLATSYSNLAMVLKDLGELAEARRLLEDAIRIDRTHYDPDHPTLATSYSNLALVLKALGDLAEARRLLEDAIRIDRTHYDADHPTLATSYSNLALVLKDLGDLAEARRRLEDAIRIWRTHYDPDHPTLATSYSNLATVLKALGDLAEARRLLEDAIRIDRTHYDADHPNLGISYGNLSKVLWQQGAQEDARALMQQAHALFSAKLGPDHPYTKTAASWLDQMS